MGIDDDTRIQTYYQSGTTTTSPEAEKSRRGILIGAIVGAVVLIAAVVVFVWYLLQPASPTERIRDIFIIFTAIMTLLLMVVLILLIIQLARLTNLMQNEIKPILESTNETINTLRGTTTFLSDNLVEPVITMNQYLAAIASVVGFMGIGRKRKKK